MKYAIFAEIDEASWEQITYFVDDLNNAKSSKQYWETIYPDINLVILARID